MKMLLTRSALTLSVVASLTLTACINYAEGSGSSAAIRGDEVFDPPRAGTVYFRSDVLGKSGDLPTAVLADSMNGARISLPGEIVELRSDAVVLLEGQSQQRVWIPRENVLAVTFVETSAR